MGQDINFAARQAELIADLRTRISDKKVLEAMARVARHLFVPAYNIELAYQDVPLPIGLGQTISQPYIVALMSSALNLTGQEKVLEIGTGSGYQTAILAELSGLVISVERLPEMARQASSLLQSLGYRNIRIHVTKSSWDGKKMLPMMPL
jgi:protein-L-isoaspartate(D-aspartate) O-methyltransferase